mmetsp:Transcript_11905/g.30092  ORF Transcript_11905/g.30092 Transcript_11905/m.30092 type:complete len:343 (+) Transcript_11905:234-1262(+)
MSTTRWIASARSDSAFTRRFSAHTPRTFVASLRVLFRPCAQLPTWLALLSPPATCTAARILIWMPLSVSTRASDSSCSFSTGSTTVLASSRSCAASHFALSDSARAISTYSFGGRPVFERKVSMSWIHSWHMRSTSASVFAPTPELFMSRSARASSACSRLVRLTTFSMARARSDCAWSSRRCSDTLSGSCDRSSAASMTDAAYRRTASDASRIFFLRAASVIFAANFSTSSASWSAAFACWRAATTSSLSTVTVPPRPHHAFTWFNRSRKTRLALSSSAASCLSPGFCFSFSATSRALSLASSMALTASRMRFFLFASRSLSATRRACSATCWRASRMRLM